MNSLIDLLDAALSADLSKRQWAAFAAVLRQTLGYRKPEDDLAPRRMAQLTGIRRNHIWQAKNDLIDKGLISSRPGQYGEILRLQTLPKTGQTVSQIGPETVPKQDTTRSHLTNSYHNNAVVVAEPVVEVAAEPALDKVPVVPEAVPDDPPAALHYPPELSATERQQAPPQLDGLTPQAAQRVLDVWALKIRRGEVRKSRIGLLIALVKAQRTGTLYTGDLSAANPLPTPPDPQQQAREQWLEQQAQQGWLRDMAQLSGQSTEQLRAYLPAAGGGL